MNSYKSFLQEGKVTCTENPICFLINHTTHIYVWFISKKTNPFGKYLFYTLTHSSSVIYHRLRWILVRHLYSPRYTSPHSRYRLFGKDLYVNIRLKQVHAIRFRGFWSIRMTTSILSFINHLNAKITLSLCGISVLCVCGSVTRYQIM